MTGTFRHTLRIKDNVSIIYTSACILKYMHLWYYRVLNQSHMMFCVVKKHFLKENGNTNWATLSSH